MHAYRSRIVIGARNKLNVFPSGIGRWNSVCIKSTRIMGDTLQGFTPLMRVPDPQRARHETAPRPSYGEAGLHLNLLRRKITVTVFEG